MTCLIWVCHCNVIAATGEVATVSTNPVCRPANTSPIERGIGDIENALKEATVAGSVLGAQVLRPLRSSGCEIGSLDMM